MRFLDFTAEYFWIIMAVLVSLCAVANALIHICVLLRIRFVWSCEYLFTEYAMLVCTVVAILSKTLDIYRLMLIPAVAILLWILLLCIRKARGIHYIRVFGIRQQMHQRLESYLADSAVANHMGRDNMYIYGGDSKTPCNMIIFRKTAKSVQRPILKDVNSFLKQYSYGAASSSLLMLLLDAAAVYITFSPM